VDAFVNTQTFRVVKEVNSLAELETMVRRGKAYVGLQIPPDFTRKLRAGQKATCRCSSTARIRRPPCRP
jgi:hypothetical protein